MKRIVLLTVVIVMLGTTPLAAQDGPAQFPWKWSQPPDLDNGWGVSSFIFPFYEDNEDYISIPAADDWKCPDGKPITVIHWWASLPPFLKEQGMTLEDLPGPPIFAFAIHADVPATGGIPSHPGERLWAGVGYWATGGDGDCAPFPAGPVFVDPQPLGPDNDIASLYYILPEPFPQEENEIYWLSIASVLFLDAMDQGPFDEENGVPIGWHTALRPGPDNGLDVAVRLTDYDVMTGTYTRWDVMYDEQGGVQLAFEFSTIPEPTSLALIGTGVLGILGLLRRRWMK